MIERCQSVRVGTAKVPLTLPLKEQLMETIREWGAGRDTLRCLALATRDSPPYKDDMDLEEASKFSQYEVSDLDLFLNEGYSTFFHLVFSVTFLLLVCFFIQ